ncbi:phosphotransferase enzyme family protein [Paenibacillus sp. J31TS4]|uniref:phosphotransferase enzyme family protein n=1 Tax=Paenibacillus sp. J31TS4 TaxID=2807195 RepID=UPI0020BEE42F|nr:phosphotransferase [Paenibacillus sp. J31TS4]
MRLTNMLAGMIGHIPAARLLGEWEHEPGSLAFWRASSNFVYSFRKGDDVFFLRFVHEDDRSRHAIEAELAFVDYLAAAGYPAAAPVRSRWGNLVESAETETGTYHGCVFRRANGRPVTAASMTASQLRQWGESLARLHLLARDYVPPGPPRPDWRETLAFVRSVLTRHPDETAAAEELERLASELARIPEANGEFGLVHYDFQSDNVIESEEEGRFSVFDFDDAMRHWFLMDVEIVRKELLEERASDLKEAEDAYAAFTAGYRTLRPIGPEAATLLPLLQRFDELYSFARVVRSLEGIDEVPDQPDWLAGLRGKLERALRRMRAGFVSRLLSGTMETSPRE